MKIKCIAPEMLSMTDRLFCHFGPFFALLLHPMPKYNNQKYQNFEKIKKTTRDIIILHMRTKKYNHMMYGS